MRSASRGAPCRGAVCGAVWCPVSLYVGVTVAVLLALPTKDIGAVQGIVEAVTRMAAQVNVGWLVPPVAFVLTLAIAGTTSAWLAGSARIPFVVGLDNYLPSGLGKLHPRFATPYVALLVQGAVSCAVLGMSFMGSTVEQGYKVLLLLAVVLQLIPYLYIFLALIRLAASPNFVRSRYSRSTLWLAGTCGLVVTALGTVLAFVPQEGGEPVWRFELEDGAGDSVLSRTRRILFLRERPASARHRACGGARPRRSSRDLAARPSPTSTSWRRSTMRTGSSTSIRPTSRPRATSSGSGLRRGESIVFLALEATRGRRALGFTQLYPAWCSVAAKPYYVLYDLFVVPEARRRSIARGLMDRAREYANEVGAYRLELQTARTNRSAQALYESLGWVRDDVFLTYTLRL